MRALEEDLLGVSREWQSPGRWKDLLKAQREIEAHSR